MFVFVLIPFSLRGSNHVLPFLSFEDLPFSSDQSFHVQILCLIEQLILSLNVDVYESQRVSDEVELDFMIERSVGGEARSVIDL